MQDHKQDMSDSFFTNNQHADKKNIGYRHWERKDSKKNNINAPYKLRINVHPDHYNEKNWSQTEEIIKNTLSQLSQTGKFKSIITSYKNVDVDTTLTSQKETEEYKTQLESIKKCAYEKSGEELGQLLTQINNNHPKLKNQVYWFKIALQKYPNDINELIKICQTQSQRGIDQLTEELESMARNLQTKTVTIYIDQQTPLPLLRDFIHTLETVLQDQKIAPTKADKNDISLTPFISTRFDTILLSHELGQELNQKGEKLTAQMSDDNGNVYYYVPEIVHDKKLAEKIQQQSQPFVNALKMIDTYENEMKQINALIVKESDLPDITKLFLKLKSIMLLTYQETPPSEDAINHIKGITAAANQLIETNSYEQTQQLRIHVNGFLKTIDKENTDPQLLAGFEDHLSNITHQISQTELKTLLQDNKYNSDTDLSIIKLLSTLQIIHNSINEKTARSASMNEQVHEIVQTARHLMETLSPKDADQLQNHFDTLLVYLKSKQEKSDQPTLDNIQKYLAQVKNQAAKDSTISGSPFSLYPPIIEEKKSDITPQPAPTRNDPKR